MSPIVSVSPFFQRLGRVSLGYKVEKTRESGEKITHPARSKNFVFHSSDRDRMSVVAHVYGGTVEQSVVGNGADDEEEERWYVVTETDRIECFAPVADERAFSAWLKKWDKTNTAQRTCDGETCHWGINAEGEVLRNVPCLCKQEGTYQTDDGCDPDIRMNVIIPALAEAPGLGVWQVASGGWGTYYELEPQWVMLRQLAQKTGVPIDAIKLELRATMKTRRVEEEGKAKTRTVPVITIDTRFSYADAARVRASLLSTVSEVKQLPQADREATQEEKKDMFDLMKARGLTREQMVEVVTMATGRPSTEGMTVKDVEKVKDLAVATTQS